ncbi:DMT family transporter [Gluconobacter sp. NFX36]|uniref:DMT family transporter n=1 Tax=Gluconobacter TaxID=441 RepID=UPI003CEB8F30
MNTSSHHSDRSSQTTLGILCGAGAGALWGLVFLAPELVRSFAPLQLSVGRYLAYGLIAVILIAPRWNRVFYAVKFQDWKALFWLSLFGNTLYYVLVSSAVHAGGIALTSLVLGFMPVAVTIIGSRDKGAVPLRSLLPSLGLCAAGAVCIGWQALTMPSPSGQSVMGLVYALAALTCWTTYAVWNSRCLMRLHHLSVHDWNLLTGLVTGGQAVVLLPIAVLVSSGGHSLPEWGRFALVSASVAVIASLFGNALWNRMSRLLPLTMTGQMILFETLFGLTYGFLWEQRAPRVLEMAAFALVIGSVLSCVAVHRRYSARETLPVMDLAA